MKYLFSAAGLKELANLKKIQNNNILFGFDFDGTLAPIVAEPSKAKLPVTTKQLLARLLKIHPDLALVSGRGKRDLQNKVPLKAKFFIGNHGLEGAGVKKKELQEFKAESNRWSSEIKAFLKSNELYNDVELEDKIYSLSLHYRNSKDPKRVEKELIKLFSKLRPKPKIVPGKCVFNIISKKAPNKGIAFHKILKTQKYQAALFVGDDITDEFAFNIKFKNYITVKVGKTKKSKAKFYLEDQKEVETLLEILLNLKTPE